VFWTLLDRDSRFGYSEVGVDEDVAAIRVLYSLDVDWSALADISFNHFNIHLAGGVFAEPDSRLEGNSRR
jgi:hypothetical protein